MKTIFVSFFFGLNFCLSMGCTTVTPRNFKITLLHTNDVHARLSQIDAKDQLCKDDEAQQGLCFGGVARRYSKIKEIRENFPNVLLLDAGDQFQGTLFYTKYQGKEAEYFMNLLGYHAMAVGNHEFDDGPEVLGRFAKRIGFPLLSANLDVTEEPALKDVIKPYTIINIQGERIGIVGLTTEETPQISSPGPHVKFLPIEEAVQASVNELNKQGVKKIFAVSHSGLDRDLEVASRVDGISVIVSGHTNTFLSNVDRTAEGPYPVVVHSPNGSPVLVVSAYAYGKYLGFLEIEFDGKGHLARWKGEPILLDKKVNEDPEIATKVAELRKPLEEMQREIVAHISQTLDGSLRKCRHEECSLGNAIADGIFMAAKPYGAVATLVNSGTIRTSLNKGSVSRWNIKDALPFGNQIALIDLSGEALWEVLEHGVANNLDGHTDGTAKFLQVSQLRYVWNPRAQAGHQIVSIELRAKDGQYQPIDLKANYRIATNRFLYNGGDGYGPVFAKAKRVELLSESLDEALIGFLRKPKHLLSSKTGRIKRVD